MSSQSEWWNNPRKISVVIDNSEWMYPYCEILVDELRDAGDDAFLCQSYDKIETGGVAFYLSCHELASKEILAKNKVNLTIHASELPKGRGWSPLTWQILEGLNSIPVCLFHTDEKVDSGSIIYLEKMEFDGSELIDEMRRKLAEISIDLCKRYLSEPAPPAGYHQQGEPTYYSRRRPEDSELNIEKSISDQFDLLRVVDNERYPAYFYHNGQKYLLKISKSKPTT